MLHPRGFDFFYFWLWELVVFEAIVMALGCLVPTEIVYGRNKGVCMGFFPCRMTMSFSLFFVPIPIPFLPLSADDYTTVLQSQFILTDTT